MSESGADVPERGGIDHELLAAMPGLLRYARTMTSDVALAEDLVQTALLRAMERSDSFDGRSSLATWLHRILHNSFVDHMRARREVPDEAVWERVEELLREPRFTVDAAEVIEVAHTASEVRDGLLRLPVNYRSAIVLHDMEGLTVPRVADIQKVSLAAAKQRVRRGRLMLVAALASAAQRHVAMKGVPMDCWDARLQVSDYLDQLLPELEARRLERHLELCPTCPPLYSAIVASRRGVSELRDANNTIPENIAARLAEHARVAREWGTGG